MRQWSQQLSAVTGMTLWGANISQWLMRWKNWDRLGWIRHTYALFKLKQSHREKNVVFLPCQIDQAIRSHCLAFQWQWAFMWKDPDCHPKTHSEKSYVAWQIIVSTSEFFLSTASIISEASAVQTDKGNSSTDCHAMLLFAYSSNRFKHYLWVSIHWCGIPSGNQKTLMWFSCPHVFISRASSTTVFVLNAEDH